MDRSTVHVVGFNGSPHRDGNTVTLMRWVMAGCAEAGATLEWIHVVDHDIRYCEGCFTCLRTGECPIQDDFLAVRERLRAADGIVVGSPVYEAQPTAQLKTFLDRLALLNLYTDLFGGQWSVGVATSGVAPTDEVARDVAGQLGRRSGTIGAKTSSVAHGYRPLAEAHDARLPDRARRVGRQLVSDIRSPSRFRLPRRERIVYRLCHRFVIQPMVRRNPDQFAGVIRIWQEQGR